MMRDWTRLGSMKSQSNFVLYRRRGLLGKVFLASLLGVGVEISILPNEHDQLAVEALVSQIGLHASLFIDILPRYTSHPLTKNSTTRPSSLSRPKRS
jgi:hypothetical protein